MFKHLTDLTQQQVVAVCVQCMRESFFSPEQTLSLLCVQCMGRAVSARGGADPEFVNQLHTNPSPKRRKINLLQAGGWGGHFVVRGVGHSWHRPRPIKWLNLLPLLVCLNYPKSYDNGSVATGRVSLEWQSEARKSRKQTGKNVVQIGCTELDETVQRNSAYVAKLKQNGANPMDSRLMVTRHPPHPHGVHPMWLVVTSFCSMESRHG